MQFAGQWLCDQLTLPQSPYFRQPRRPYIYRKSAQSITPSPISPLWTQRSFPPFLLSEMLTAWKSLSAIPHSLRLEHLNRLSLFFGANCAPLIPRGCLIAVLRLLLAVLNITSSVDADRHFLSNLNGALRCRQELIRLPGDRLIVGNPNNLAHVQNAPRPSQIYPAQLHASKVQHKQAESVVNRKLNLSIYIINPHSSSFHCPPRSLSVVNQHRTQLHNIHQKFSRRGTIAPHQETGIYNQYTYNPQMNCIST